MGPQLLPSWITQALPPHQLRIKEGADLAGHSPPHRELNPLCTGQQAPCQSCPHSRPSLATKTTVAAKVEICPLHLTISNLMVVSTPMQTTLTNRTGLASPASASPMAMSPRSPTTSMQSHLAKAEAAAIKLRAI